MRYKIKKVKKKYWELRFNEKIPTTDFIFDLPLLIDYDNNVLLGNSLRKQFIDGLQEIKCVIMKNNSLIIDTFFALEESIILENNVERFWNIKNTFYEYLKSLNEQTEVFSLFELPRETRFISNENFDKPPEYNFIKNSKKKDEVVKNATLFSRP